MMQALHAQFHHVKARDEKYIGKKHDRSADHLLSSVCTISIQPLSSRELQLAMNDGKTGNVAVHCPVHPNTDTHTKAHRFSLSSHYRKKKVPCRLPFPE